MPWPAKKRVVTLGDLIVMTAWLDVAESLRRVIRDVTSPDDYRQVFDELRAMTPRPTSMRIVIRRQYRADIDEEPFDEIIGKNGTLNRDTADFKLLEATAAPGYAISEVEYGLDFHPRAEWLGMMVDEETLNAYPAAGVVALSVHEMTFFGFSERQVAQSRDEIGRRADEVRSMTEAERRKFLIPAEVVFKRRGPT